MSNFNHQYIYEVGDRNNAVEGTVKVERLDTPPVQPPKYETNMDSED